MTESPDLTPDEIQNLAPGCITPHRADNKRELLNQINAHHNKGYATGGTVNDETEVRLWDHQRDDTYIVIIRYEWFDQDGLNVDHHSDRIEMSFGKAILAGVAIAESDAFNIGVIRDHRLVAVLWIDQITETDSTVLATISEEIGLTA